MASAAAVSTDITRTPPPESENNELLGTEGGITHTDDTQVGEAINGDPQVARIDGTKVQVTDIAPLRDSDADHKHEDGEPEQDEDEEELDEDLFGDDDDTAAQDSKKQRRVEDEELDSGDDGDREDRKMAEAETQAQPTTQVEFSGMDVDLGRHAKPEPSDGELYLMKVPKFLSVEPHQFTPQSFQPPSTDHHSTKEPSSTFSAYKTALTTIRWRQSPSDPSRLQSNARLIRWSNGELTLQFASDPSTQYAITGNQLAPRQRGPRKPTPTSKPGARQPYNAEEDQFTYLAAAQEMAGMLRITNKLTTGLKIQSATEATSEALERLQNSLASSTHTNSNAVNGGGMSIARITEDPELAKKKAEAAEKEKARAQKRREAAETRDRERQGRAFGRSGYGAGLTVGGLEDDDELGKGITRLPAVGKRKPKTNRRGEIYSEDEDEYNRRGRTREDEYDEEDDFVAGSDEEEEVVDDDDVDDGIVETPKDRREKPSPKRPAPARTPVDDAEGDMDEDPDQGEPAAGSPHGRNKRRRVIEEDEDE